MTPDITGYGIIICVVAVFAIGFTAWAKSAPKSRKPEQVIFFSVSAFAAVTFAWLAVSTYRVWRETGINTMRGEYLRFAQVAGLALLFGIAFWASRAKEKEERLASLTSHEERKDA